MSTSCSMFVMVVAFLVVMMMMMLSRSGEAFVVIPTTTTTTTPSSSWRTSSSVVSSTSTSRTALLMASTSSSSSSEATIKKNDDDPPIIISGQNVELTDSLIEHVNKRIGGPIRKLSKSGAIRECDVVLSLNKNPKVRNGHLVEVITNLKGTTIICKNESPDMYNSIDSASHALNRKLLKYKERRVAGWHGGGHMGDELSNNLDLLEDDDEEDNVVDDDDEFFTDPYKPDITKIKSFDLQRSISLDEAIFALDYVDHDFYVFRNEETNKINVVYKRNVGGVGLIEP